MNNVNFVVSNWAKWQRKLTSDNVSIDDIATDFISNEDIWVVLTFLQLSARGLSASIGPQPVPRKINIVDGININTKKITKDIYSVGCRGDGHYPGLCQQVIQQNLIYQEDESATYIPQWAQPGIICRSEKRCGIETIGFLGHAATNLAPAFHEVRFADRLRSKGCALVLRDKVHDRACWNDYSEIDLCLSVREIPAHHLRLKPVNKLSNAWKAGVPSLVGDEPAIAAIKQSELDFLLVKTPADVITAIERLRAESELYDQMVKNGGRRATQFDDTAIASRWFDVLSQIKRDFAIWNCKSDAEKADNYIQRKLKLQKSLDKHDELIHQAYFKLGYPMRWWESESPVHREGGGSGFP